MNDCEKCRDPKAWPPESVTLPGGIAAQLCTACMRAFTLMVYKTELNDRAAVLEARGKHYRDLAFAGQPVTETARIELQRNQDALALELAEASVAWLGQTSEPLGTTERG